jgi:threonine dehydrogenase-like Zn-dependent dehydrogenase
MLAAKITGKETVKVVETPIPVPGKGEVLIRMRASALCRSDLYRYHGEALFDESDGAVITPGHEPCGVVEQLGEGVDKVKVGDRVALFLGLGCGVCEHCLAGDVILCPKFNCIGFQVDGAHADFMVIPQENCLPLPDSMSFVTGALSTDVGGTLYTTCKRLAVNGSMTVVVFGVGPMGCGGVLMAKAFGAQVIAVDVDEKRLALARELGADQVINAKDASAVAQIQAWTHGKGADACIVCAGGNTLNDALDCVKKYGEVAVIAESSSCTIRPSEQFIRKLVSLRGCWYFNRADWQEIADFIVSRNIALEKISTHTFGLRDADQAFSLFDRHLTQKVVFVWE